MPKHETKGASTKTRVRRRTFAEEISDDFLTPPGTKKWEYMTIEGIDRDDGDTLIEDLERAGSAGWELVTVQSYRDCCNGTWKARLVFKRPNSSKSK